MSDEQGYNGWPNYETWCMALWIDNDLGNYNYARELVHEETVGMDMASEERHVVTCRSADALMGWQEEVKDALTDDQPASVFTDLLGAAFGEIDWYEIARVILSEAE